MGQGARSIWQISAGPTTRSYADVFLTYGVALIGPGDAGPWNNSRDDDQFEGGTVRRFASELRDGDVLLMRTGLATVAAVGSVVGDYAYLQAFDDVNGRDLQHARRTRWCRLPVAHQFPTAVFGANPAPCSRVFSPVAVDFAERFINSPPTHWQTEPLPSLPIEEPPLEEVPRALRDIVAQVADLVPLLQDAQRFGDPPYEDELVAHFVVPYLRALGWPPERIAVQWRRVDVALFRALPRLPENCELIIEAKRFGAGIEGALEQAKGYVEALAPAFQ